MKSKYMRSGKVPALFLPLIILVMLCSGKSISQSEFRLDSTGIRYWDGAAWHEVGNDEYESLVRLHGEPQRIYRAGKNISGIGTVLMIAGPTIASLGGLSVMVAMDAGDEGERQSTAKKMYVGGAALLVSGVILHIVGQHKILESAHSLESVVNSSGGILIDPDVRIGPTSMSTTIVRFAIAF